MSAGGAGTTHVLIPALLLPTILGSIHLARTRRNPFAPLAPFGLMIVGTILAITDPAHRGLGLAFGGTTLACTWCTWCMGVCYIPVIACCAALNKFRPGETSDV
jgi:hypothetical protein